MTSKLIFTFVKTKLKRQSTTVYTSTCHKTERTAVNYYTQSVKLNPFSKNILKSNLPYFVLKKKPTSITDKVILISLLNYVFNKFQTQKLRHPLYHING